MNIRHYTLGIVIFATLIRAPHLLAGEPASAPPPPESFTLEQCLETALKRNPAILKSQEDLKRTYGVIVETRSEALPQVRATGQMDVIDENFIDTFPGMIGGPADNQKMPWEVGIQISQLVYSGGRVNAALRAARITDQIAKESFHRVVSNTILEVRTVFYRILLARAQIHVHEQSIQLLENQLKDVTARFEAGTVPRFNVLRAEVELANARPPLIRAQNNYRLAREAMARLLAFDSKPQTAFSNIQFEGALRHEQREVDLKSALAQAVERRPELRLARHQAALRRENITVAKSGYQPDLSVYAGYGARNSRFGDQLDDTTHGWFVGARATWNIFDGQLTRGKVQQAQAEFSQAEIEAEDIRRVIELEVRQAYSDYVQALELLEAQKRVIEQAEESLRLAEARFQAGAGTQLDVLSARTALTEAQSNEILALHEYNLALAALDRATGANVRVDD